MKIVVDTSLWIDMLRDPSGNVAAFIDAEARGGAVIMLPPIRLELLQGCKGEAEWNSMVARVEAFELVAMAETIWDEAARLYFDLRQTGKTVRSTLDCCIAQICLGEHALLLHNDRDFEVIAALRPLHHRRFDLGSKS